MKLKWDLLAVPQKLDKLVTHPILVILVKGTLSNWEFPLVSEQCHLGGWDDADEMKLSSFSFVVLRVFYVAEIS